MLKQKLSAILLSLLCTAVTLPAAAMPETTGQSIEVGFSPDGTAEALVLRSIASARRSVRLAAYSFTSPKVVRAMLDAKKRGVDVAVVVDYKHNNSSKATRAALNLLVNEGIPTRTIDAYAIQHSKYAVIDGLHVQTGSYNYSDAAANKNSENALVIWNRRDLANAYNKNWQWLFDQGRPYVSSY